MRVLLDTTYARRGPSGTATYLAGLGAALEAAGVEVVRVSDEGRAEPAGGGLGSARNLARDAWWVHRELPRLARRHAVDVLHHPLPALAVRARTPQVVTVHDVAFLDRPDDFDPRFRAVAARTHRLAARRADAVVAVSEATARAVERHFGVPRTQITVARHGPGRRAPRPPRPPRPEHFLYVGDDEPRKNLPLLLAAHARYVEALTEAHRLHPTPPTPLPLVLAGSMRHGSLAYRKRQALSIRERPGDEELAGLLAGAAALVHPSRHEGFGLTPLEAMAAGTPVLAVRNDGVSEVCGDAALYVEPGDVAALADRLAALHLDPALRRERSELGLQRAAGFSWAASARAHLDAYAAAIVRGEAKR